MTQPNDYANKDPAKEGVKLHLGIAEQGKLYALEGNHQMALMYYRHAMNMTVQAKDPEIFFRHYLECVIESLEQSESYDEVLAYCDKAIQHYAELQQQYGKADAFALRDLAHIHQRKGLVLLKTAQKQTAKQAFQQAVDIMRQAKQKIPLAETLLRWLSSGLHIDEQRVIAEQQRTHYFSIREETVNPKRAIKLPNEEMLGVKIG